MKQRRRHLGGQGQPAVECIDTTRGTWVFRWDFRDEEEGNVSFLEEWFDHEPTEAEKKNVMIETEHPFGDEYKILRKTIRKMLTETKYNSEAFAEFRAYNEYAESIELSND